jgi:PBSX family phage terminase large subunit
VQQTYQDFVTDKQHLELMWVGGVGCGKSDALVTRAGLLAGAHPGLRSVIARSDSVKLASTTLPKFLEKWNDGVSGKFHQRHGTYKLTAFVWTNGHITYFIGLGDTQAKERLKSMEVVFIGMDEANEIDEETWKMALARLRQQRDDGGPVLYSLFGVANFEGRNWIYKRFKADETNNYSVNRRLFEASTTDNHSLPIDYIKNISNDPLWKRKYVDGSWESSTGLVFPEFSETKHIRPTQNILQETPVTYVVAIDHGLKSPTAATLWGIDGAGRWYGIREYYESLLSSHQNAENIRLWANDVRVSVWVIDPSTFNEDPRQPGQSIAMDYQVKGIPVVRGNNSLSVGIARLRWMLQTPGMFAVNPSMTNFIREIQTWSWKDNAAGKDKPQDGGDHALDTARYAVMGIPLGFKAALSPVEAFNSPFEWPSDDDDDRPARARKTRGGY